MGPVTPDGEALPSRPHSGQQTLGLSVPRPPHSQEGPGAKTQRGPRTLSPRPFLPAKTAPPLAQQCRGQPGVLPPRRPPLLVLLPKPLCWLLQLSIPTLLKPLLPTPHPTCLLQAPAACSASPRGIYRHLKLSPKNRSSLPKPASPIFPSVRCRHLRLVFSGARPLFPAPPPASLHSPAKRPSPKGEQVVFSLTSGPCCAHIGHMLTSSLESQGSPGAPNSAQGSGSRQPLWGQSARTAQHCFSHQFVTSYCESSISDGKRLIPA